MLRVIRTFQKVEHVQLACALGDARRNVVVLVQNQIGVLGAVAVWRYLACVDGAFCIREE